MNDTNYNEKDFLVVVVIYETEFDNSFTLQRLLEISKGSHAFPDILIYDNSLKNKICQKNSELHVYYKHDWQNSGVSGAYNYALALAAELKKSWLILFDQDTNVNDNYFSQLMLAVKKYPRQKLFCPTVISNNRIVSPTYYFANKSFVFSKQKKGLLESRFHTIINSGLSIKVDLLGQLGGYDEDLPLDFSDHLLFWKYKTANRYFVVIDSINLHNLSSDTDRVFQVVYNRFKKYYVSAIIYSKKVNSFFPLIWLLFRALKLTLKYLKSDFLKLLVFKE